MSVVAVNAPLNATVPTVLVSVTVVALTVLLKVVPPEWVMVSVPTSETDEPLISAPATPPVTKVRLYVAPVTAPMVRSATLVVAFVLSVVAAPKVMAPKVMAALVLLMVPLMIRTLGAVAVKPPVNVKLSPLASPKYSPPDVPKVTALVICVVLP